METGGNFNMYEDEKPDPIALGEQRGLLSDYAFVRKQAMQSLFETLDTSSEGTVVVDSDARIVWINRSYAERFGFTNPEAVIGLDCEVVIPNSLMREVVTTGRPILLDILETGQEPLVVTRLPIKDSHGKTVGAVGFALFDELKVLTPMFSTYSRLQSELLATRQSLAQARRAKYSFSSFVGTSAASLETKRLGRRAAQLDSPVLLLGETGTGKELLAHAIHGASPRADKPLVSVNVAAIPDALLEVEFFGAAAGAYTGADRKGRTGKFELAQGGTLFLDEIGDMPLPLQGKLLRALQEREFEPIGSNRVVQTDVRIIAATSADLPALVAQGRFRADLYYRLNVLMIRVPPLRDRPSDIEAMSYAILDRLSSQRDAGHLELDEGAIKRLMAYHWPGNVRELQNTLERVALLSESERIDALALARFIDDGRGSTSEAGAQNVAKVADVTEAMPTEPVVEWKRYDDAMKAFERQFLTESLRAAGGRVSEAAARLGMGRATLYKKMTLLGIDLLAPE
ncbi:sigma-54 dependent transcription regulator [Pandoraea horticolens]|uniref:Sigma-54 dependent transcription regulator n=2 Tax=Pandoraea horticolens TaxID=2508298 RepID=A0A5E4W315_9BURK|nr:sigma-54 dependent transcription regulator [Pandoraea horticolens]